MGLTHTSIILYSNCFYSESSQRIIGLQHRLNIFQFNYGSTVTPNWLRTSRKLSIKYSNDASNTALDENSNAAINTPIISTLEWNDDTTLYTTNTALNTITVNQNRALQNNGKCIIGKHFRNG
ncbi:MAG: hypothetical protein ACO3VF_00310 [Tamlana sp.]